MTFDNAEKQAATHGVPPLLTEFGATTDRATLEGVSDLAMKYRMGWQYWAYCGCNDPTTTGPGNKQALVFDPSKPPTGANVDHAKLAALVVPHPLLVAGTPSAYHYDRGTRVFTMTWTTSKAGSLPGRFGTGARTLVSVPRLDYPSGYRVQVTGAKVVSGSSASTLVLTQRARRVVGHRQGRSALTPVSGTWNRSLSRPYSGVISTSVGSTVELVGQQVVAQRVDQFAVAGPQRPPLLADPDEAVGLDDLLRRRVALRHDRLEADQAQSALGVRREAVPHHQAARLGHQAAFPGPRGVSSSRSPPRAPS